MNFIEFSSNLLILIPILVIFPLVNSSTSCSIFPSLNCSCFQSNIDLNSSLSIKTYSHLYCQGNSLTKTTFQSPFGSDFKYQNHFRTVSIEFSTENRIEIQSNQFDSFAMLFSETNINDQINISLRFIGFSHITFHKHSLTSTLFQRKHQNKHLWVHLIPARSNLTEIELDAENFTKLENQFKFFSNCFSGLIVSQLTLSIHTIRDYFPSFYSFERIFNNTNIGELHFYGSIIRPGSSSLRRRFQGLIKSLIVHRHVDTIDSNTFPFYSQVYSYTIHSIEAHSMNLSSFLFSHRNLRGLEIIQPRFEVSIDQFLPTLDSLTLDIEHLNEKTLLFARHIHNLKLGSHLRTIKSEVLNFLSYRLHHLDLSDIDLYQMTLDSRCYLMKYLLKNSQNQLNIIYPQIKSLTECDCTRIFLNDIQFQTKTYSTCSKLCHFSDCQIISEYFKEKYPLDIHRNQSIEEKNHFNEDLSSVEIYSDPDDVDMISFLLNQTSEQERNETQRRSSTTIATLIDIELSNISSLENIEEYDDKILFSTTIFSESSNDQINRYEIESFSWLAFFIGVGVVLFLVLIISFIILLIIRYRKEHNFKPVPVYV